MLKYIAVKSRIKYLFRFFILLLLFLFCIPIVCLYVPGVNLIMQLFQNTYPKTHTAPLFHKGITGQLECTIQHIVDSQCCHTESDVFIGMENILPESPGNTIYG